MSSTTDQFGRKTGKAREIERLQQGAREAYEQKKRATKRTYIRDGYKLVQTDVAVGHRSGETCYRVITDAKGFIGIVGSYQQMFERGPRRARYVTTRWYSQRWFFYVNGPPRGRRRTHFEGPGKAAEAMIWETSRHKR